KALLREFFDRFRVGFFRRLYRRGGTLRGLGLFGSDALLIFQPFEEGGVVEAGGLKSGLGPSPKRRICQKEGRFSGKIFRRSGRMAVSWTRGCLERRPVVPI